MVTLTADATEVAAIPATRPLDEVVQPKARRTTGGVNMNTSSTAFNAVFKGGGAKGIAYAGALQACEEQHVEFPEVAGSSAGAITATLVACGYTSAEIVEEMPVALASIGNVAHSLAMIGMRPSLLGSDHLHEWLVDVIGRAVPGRPGEDCTFADVERVHDKKLYVITLDLSTRQPRVFSPDLTPDSPVAAAVVASSAIPVAFPSSRMAIDDQVHRLVDGGTWANYPAFVFHDNDFRHCHGLGPNTRPTLGFILDEGDPPQAPGDRSSPTPQHGGSLIGDKGSSTDQLDVMGAVLSSPAFRWLAALLPLMFVILSLMWIRDEMLRPDPWIAKLPEWLHEPVLVAVVAVFSLTGIIAMLLSFVILRLGRSIFDSGIIGAMAAIGVGPSVPYWVGKAGDDDHTAVRINVPDELTTLKFDADEQTRQAACFAGYSATRAELAGLARLGELPPSLVPMLGPIPPTKHRPEGTHALVFPLVRALGSIFTVTARSAFWLAGKIRDNGWIRLAATAYALVGGTTAAFNAFESFAHERALIGLLWLGVVGTAVTLGAWLLANGRRNEAKRPTPYPRLGRRSVGQLRTIGAICLAFAALSAYGMFDLGEASFVTASRAAQVTGQVVDIRGANDEWDVDVEIDDLDLAATLLGADAIAALERMGASGADAVDQNMFDRFYSEVFENGLEDLYGENVGGCGFTGDTTCYTLHTRQEPRVTEAGEIDVRVDLQRGRIFLDRDVWDGGRGQSTIQIILIIGLVFLGVGLRALRAARWKSQPRLAEGPLAATDPIDDGFADSVTHTGGTA